MKEAEILKKISELEKVAGNVLEVKRRNRPRRPIVIEFAGSPKAGKSSAISSLDIFLRRNKFRTKVLTERASVCPIPNKFDPLFNIWTGCAALNQLAETLSTASLKLDVIILDRGFFDALCWFEWQRNEQYLREDDYQNFIGFFTSPRFRMMVDLVLLFDAMPKTSIEREYRNLLTRQEGSIMRENILSSYREIMSNAKEKYSNLFRELVLHATDKEDQNQVSFNVTKKVLGSLKNLADENIAHVDRSNVPNVKTVFNFSEIKDVLEREMRYSSRTDVEENDNYVQFLPIGVIKQKGENRFLVGTKTQKATSASSPEKNRILSYFGGHVRKEDKDFVSNGDVLNVFKQCLYREIKEEIGLDIDPIDLNPKCIWVRDGTRSEKHIAIVFVIERNLENLKTTVDGEEFAKYEKKGRVGTGDILTAAELLDSKIDSWSLNIIKNILMYDINNNSKEPMLI